jgi:hypothetical protein
MRNIFRIGLKDAFLITLLVILAPNSVSAQGGDMPEKSRQHLTVSPDGKFLVDETGKNVMQYLKSAKAYVPTAKQGVEMKSANGKTIFYPCNCRYECIAWEGETCVQKVRTCDICTKNAPDK